MQPSFNPVFNSLVYSPYSKRGYFPGNGSQQLDPGGDEFYFQPDGTSGYLRPDGTSTYIRP